MSDVRRYEKALKRLNKRGLPFAIRNTLNDAAFATMRGSKKNIRDSFILRNTFTQRSIHVRRATGLNINNMRSQIGSAENYMADQEFGGIRRPAKRGKTASIPTSSAAGQGMGVVPRTKTVRKPNRLDQIQANTKRYQDKVRRGRTTGKINSDKQAAIATMAMALREKERFVFLELPWGQRARGIFKLMGSQRKPKVRLIHEMSRKFIPIKKQPWLKPATDKTETRMPRMYARRIGEQLRFTGAR